MFWLNLNNKLKEGIVVEGKRMNKWIMEPMSIREDVFIFHVL